MALDDYNGVRSTIIDEWQTTAAVNMTRDGTFIFGTAKKGPKNTPIAVTSETVMEIFGEVATDASFETSAVRGFYEFAQASANDPDVYIVRVGKTAAASISLYESARVTSGELSYSLNEDGGPCESLWIKAVNEGSDYNKVKVAISADEEGFTNYMSITLPDGTSQHFNLSPFSGASGVISKVSDLVKQINANSTLSGTVYAGYTPLEKNISLAITKKVDGSLQTNYNIDAADDSVNQSWGDKLVSIKTAYQTKNVYQTITAGDVTAELAIIPEKLTTEGSKTLAQFIRKSDDEVILTVSPVLVGKKDVVKPLYCSKISGWNKLYSIKGNSAADHNWTFKLQVRRNGTSTKVDLPASAYTVNEQDGTVTIHEALGIGDVYLASYRFEVSYSEAKLRSNLTTGSDKSYFVFGGTVVFGAEQPMETIVYYNTKVYFNAADVTITNSTTGEIEFTNAANLPAAGLNMNLVIQYEPELPAPTATVILGEYVQPGALSGGDDGRLVSKSDYLKALVEALQHVDLYPRRHNLVMGMYLDDTVNGFNEETGLPQTKPLNMIIDVLPYIERACNYTNECDIALPVRPPTDLSQTGINNWIKKLITNDSEDICRPANIIDSLTSFRIDVPVGAFVVSIPEVNSGIKYLANPASIFLAAKAALGLSDSITNRAVPGSIKDLAVKIFNAETIGNLNAKRYTSAVVNYNGTVIWADGPTCAISGVSQFDRQFVRDTVYTAIGLAREVAAKYIGKPRRAEYLMSLKKDVGKALGALVPDVIDDMFIDIVPVSGGNITGRTKLRMMLTTAKEIRSVEIETHIKLAE